MRLPGKYRDGKQTGEWNLCADAAGVFSYLDLLVSIASPDQAEGWCE
ncbi:hypothetical protein RSK20926_11034 [Roseobacter sp. SK209-2-6]|nr:hypothetical protein RSK20926_11034 [Roseobacter sp. SK209-2-6]